MEQMAASKMSYLAIYTILGKALPIIPDSDLPGRFAEIDRTLVEDHGFRHRIYVADYGGARRKLFNTKIHKFGDWTDHERYEISPLYFKNDMDAVMARLIVEESRL
jgi:hypothetical protein